MPTHTPTQMWTYNSLTLPYYLYAEDEGDYEGPGFIAGDGGSIETFLQSLMDRFGMPEAVYDQIHQALESEDDIQNGPEDDEDFEELTKYVWVEVTKDGFNWRYKTSIDLER